MIINQERNRDGPLWEKGLRVTWSRTTKWVSEKERLTRGAHPNITRRYILKVSKHGRRNSLLIEYRDKQRSRAEAIEVLRHCFASDEAFENAREEIEMTSLNDKAWTLSTKNYKIADRIYHTHPTERGREIINRLYNVILKKHIPSNRDWEDIIRDHLRARKEAGHSRERENRLRFPK